jgi:hypothetical protein
MHTDSADLAAKLQVPAVDDRASARDRYLARLRGELEGLLAYLRDQEEKLGTKRIDPASGAYHAIEILGAARYAPAASFLMTHLDVRSTAFSVVSDEFRAHFPFFPCAVAVSAIGTPAAITALRDEIARADATTTRFQLGCLVLKNVVGVDLALLLIAHLAKQDPQFRQKQEHANRLVQMNVDEWEATFCSDFTVR